MTRKLLSITLLVGLTTASVWAQDEEPEQQPGRAVARVSLLSGDVSVKRGDAGENVAAAINAPLMTGDEIAAGPGSNAEIQLDYSNFIRMSGESGVHLSDIENDRYLIQVSRGTVTYRILRDLNGQVELSTPSIAVRPLRKGIYRVTVLPDGTTEITVREGEAEVFSPQGSERITPGHSLLARGSTTDAEFQIVNARSEDEWDRWNDRRDRDLQQAATSSYNHVSRDISGAEDLEGNGRWVSTPEYGDVWSPTVSDDWAPYRNGRWSWLDYYGWSWVSYDPWGWAPYHYGRWYRSPSYGWCWWPGRQSARHYWSPALVGFFGWGSGGFSAGFGFGNVGWVPLAPFERYHPWYGSRYYGGYRNGSFNHVVINNTNIVNVYRNARFQNAITGVDARNFGHGSVKGVRVDHAQLQNAGMVRGQLPLTPSRDSLRMTDREARISAGGRASDHFYSRQQPSRIDRVPFEQQRSSISGSRQSLPSVAADGRGDRNANSGSSWRRFGDPGSSSRTSEIQSQRGNGRQEIRTGSSSQSTTDSGWTRFGDRGRSASQGSVSEGAMNTYNRSEANRSVDRGRFDRQNYERNNPAPSGSATYDRGSRTQTAPQRQESQRTYDSPRQSPSYGGYTRQESPRQSPSFGGNSRQESPRFNAPVVRERSSSPQPSFSRGDRGGSSPSMRSAPSSGGGGGGRSNGRSGR